VGRNVGSCFRRGITRIRHTNVFSHKIDDARHHRFSKRLWLTKWKLVLPALKVGQAMPHVVPAHSRLENGRLHRSENFWGASAVKAVADFIRDTEYVRL